MVAYDQEKGDKYRSWQKTVTRDMTEKELAEARHSDDYKVAYHALTGELEKIPAEKAPKSCCEARAGLKIKTQARGGSGWLEILDLCERKQCGFWW